jgi:hypothetical protein
MRRALAAAAILLALPGAGCTILDRESYSVMIRKEAHVYDTTLPDAVPDHQEEESVAQAVADTGKPYWVRDDLDALIQGIGPKVEAFRPFAYCHLHESWHFLESVFAIALAPVEYPLTLATHVVTQPVILGFEALLGPVTIEEEEKPKTK